MSLSYTEYSSAEPSAGKRELVPVEQGVGTARRRDELGPPCRKGEEQFVAVGCRGGSGEER